jgi:hypothetical protein
MDFGFETRTSMKSFANSLSNGSILWTLEGTPKKRVHFMDPGRDPKKRPLFQGPHLGISFKT